MPSKPTFTKRKGGYQAADFRVKITIDYGTYQQIEALAKTSGESAHQIITRHANDSFFGSVHDEIADAAEAEGDQ